MAKSVRGRCGLRGATRAKVLDEMTPVDSGSLSVIIPVYNEEENIGPLVEQLQSALKDWPGEVEFLFVDDGSTDGTLEELKHAQSADPRMRIVHFRRNLGQTAAMEAGFHLAVGSAVVTLDGDLQNDPAEVPRLARLLSDCDVACGIRTRRQDTWWKRRSSRIANGFRNWATGDDIVDTGCTLKAFRRQCVECLELYNGMHRFLPTLLKMRGYRVKQVPVSHHPRRAGKTKYDTWKRLKKGLADVWAVRWMKKNWIAYEQEFEVLVSPATSRCKNQEVGKIG
jgi:dolichol-phosphate mannosyltransferase